MGAAGGRPGKGAAHAKTLRSCMFRGVTPLCLSPALLAEGSRSRGGSAAQMTSRVCPLLIL